MYLSARTQCGLSVSARTVHLRHLANLAASCSVIECGSRIGSRCVASCKGMSYFVKTADRQQIKNESDGLQTMKSIKSSTSSNATSRKNLESRSPYATHPRNEYVRLRTDRTRNKCFMGLQEVEWVV